MDIYLAEPDMMSRMDGKIPLTAGHEFCGNVVGVGGDVTHVKEGDYVSAEMHITCGVCYQCRTGNGHVCRNTVIKGIDADGSFAEYVVVPGRNVLPLDADLPVEVAAFLDALGNAVHVANAVSVAESRVAVLGCGPIGLMAIAIAKHCGAVEVLATDVRREHLDWALRMGADAVFDVSNGAEHTGFLDRARSDRSRGGVDVVLEISGVPQAYEDALKIVRMGGDVCMLGLPQTPVTMNLASDVVFRGVTLRGIVGRRMFGTWFDMLDYLRSGLQDKIRSLATHHFALEDFEKGFALKASGEALKVILYPGGVPG